MKKLILIICILLAPLAMIPLSDANGPTDAIPHPRGYVCFKTNTAPKIDGKLDDPAWKAAPWSQDFVDIEGNSKPLPTHRTRMKMLWDDKGLYIASEIQEPHIWATLTEHDSVIFHDPDFEVFIDPDGDNHLYAELELNALNTTWDLLLSKPYKDGGRALNGWEAIGLKAAVHINGTINNPNDTDTRWTVEIFWPWVGLKELSQQPIPPKDGNRWRINFSRVEWDTTIEQGRYIKVKGKPEYNWVWSPQGVIDMHRPERWGYLQFSTQTEGNVDYKPDPEQGVKDLLHEVYYSQRNYHKKFGKFTQNFADLQLNKNNNGIPNISLTPYGFEAIIALRENSLHKQWGINSESFLWSK